MLQYQGPQDLYDQADEKILAYGFSQGTASSYPAVELLDEVKLEAANKGLGYIFVCVCSTRIARTYLIASVNAIIF